MSMVFNSVDALCRTSEIICKSRLYRRLSDDLFYSQFDKENYEKSYANPAYAVKVLGDEYGQLLSAVYAKIAGSITHIYQGDIKYLCIYAELIVELYNYFENANELSPDEIRGCIYSFMHDYEEIFAEDDNRALLDPAYDYYTELVAGNKANAVSFCIGICHSLYLLI